MRWSVGEKTISPLPCINLIGMQIRCFFVSQCYLMINYESNNNNNNNNNNI